METLQLLDIGQSLNHVTTWDDSAIGHLEHGRTCVEACVDAPMNITVKPARPKLRM